MIYPGGRLIHSYKDSALAPLFLACTNTVETARSLNSFFFIWLRALLPSFLVSFKGKGKWLLAAHPHKLLR